VAFQDTGEGVRVPLEDFHMEAGVDERPRLGRKGHKPAPRVLRVGFDGVCHEVAHAEAGDNI
jgi:hypothetical protein